MFMRRIFSLLIMVVLALSIQPAFAGITGKVSNNTGKPVANAVITLVGHGIMDTTGVDGSFAIVPVGVAGSHQSKPHSTTITLNKGVMAFSLADPSPVRIEMFDVNGTMLAKEVRKNVQAGFYRFNVAQCSRSLKILVIRAAVGDQEMTFRYVSLNSRNYSISPTVEQSKTEKIRLAKVTAVNDTLKVVAANYETKSVPIASYDTTVNISLDTIGDVMTVRLDQARQVIDGFGINNNWKPLGSSGIDACFDSVNGLGLSILRIGMFSDGNLFSSNSWDDVKKAKAKGCKYIIGSTWSPPGSYKTNGSENDGGHVKPEKYEAWATTIAAFPGKVKQNAGVDLYAMSVGNEPDFASCGMSEPCNGNYPTTLYTAEEMVAFVKIAGPKLQAAGCKVMAPEASEWLHTWSDSSACCSVPGNKPSSDPFKCGFPPTKCAPGKGYDYGHYLFKDKDAWAAVDIFGVHQYDNQVATPWPADVSEKKPVWQTEMSGVKWWPDGKPDASIENGLAVAGWIHNALTVGEANGWLYWWYNGGSETNEGLLINGQDTRRHYTFGNYTRYVRPGMTRVDVTGIMPKDVLISAFKGSGTAVVIVAINKGANVTIPITISGGALPGSFTPVVTSGSEDWATKTAVTVSNGILTATLGAKTITTFVGK